MKRNGTYANGRQRWFCKECRRSYRWSNPSNKLRREKIWFERWITEGYSVRQLTEQSSLTRTKLNRIVDYWLATPPPEQTSSLEQHKHVIFDGTFLHRPVSIVVLMAGGTHSIIDGLFGINENSIGSLRRFFEPLTQRGLQPRSCTVDGNPQVMTVLRELWPDIVVQRCLVHIQRQGLMWCRQNPRRSDARKLREIFLQVMSIHTHDDRRLFLEQVALWEKRYGSRIVGLPEQGPVFSDIKRARSMLMRAMPDMFHYLDDPEIPRTTNGLEGYFSRLKRHYRGHRGLHPSKRHNYFAWYFRCRLR